MVRTVEGVFRDGKVELLETPAGVDEARVLVVFLPGTNGSASSEVIIERVIGRMTAGYDLGGAPYPARGELYDRFGDE